MAQIANRNKSCRFFSKGFCKYGDKCNRFHSQQYMDHQIYEHKLCEPIQCSNKNCEYISNPIITNTKGTCCKGCKTGNHTLQCINRTQNSIANSWIRGPFY